jgi:hypothetical protein
MKWQSTIRLSIVLGDCNSQKSIISASTIISELHLCLFCVEKKGWSDDFASNASYNEHYWCHFFYKNLFFFGSFSFRQRVLVFLWQTFPGHFGDETEPNQWLPLVVPLKALMVALCKLRLLVFVDIRLTRGKCSCLFCQSTKDDREKVNSVFQ